MPEPTSGPTPERAGGEPAVRAAPEQAAASTCPPQAAPVFFDPAGRRRRGINGLAAILGATLLCSAGVTLLGLWQPDALPALHLGHHARELRALQTSRSQEGPEAGWSGGGPGQAAPLQVTGFFVAWDDNSLSSLKHNLGALDVLAPEWWHLGAGGTLVPESPGKNAGMLAYVARHRPGLPITPLVNNYDAQRQDWASARVAAVLRAPGPRAALVERLRAGVVANHFAGLNLDFENLPGSAQPAYVAFVGELGAALHRAGKTLTVDAPLDDPAFDYRALGQRADSVLLMAYDEHEDRSEAGPIASQGWVQRRVAQRLREIPASRLSVALGSYGYDWGAGTASELSFQDALSLAQGAQETPHLDRRALNPTFAYADEAGRPHRVWYLDAASTFDAAQALRALGVRRVAMWRLGTEDPGVWTALRSAPAQVARALSPLQAGYDIDYQGSGELLRVSGHPHPGARQLTLDPATHLVTAEHLTTFATPYVIQRWGGRNPRQVALTFDDGPDPLYTPQILDILKRARAPATFFVVGLHGEAHPELLRRMVNEGHQLGSHTFTHPDLSLVSRHQFALELNATQRLIEGETGVRTLLFRPPFAEDVEPETPDQAGIVEGASRLGYYISGMGIDPGDWRRPGADQIVQQTLAQLAAGNGQVVLLHDGGATAPRPCRPCPP
ncbi:polysaccharide deacetylase family protein [Deinococcus multiflagellatus]|uniref:Polysaccharide deacetylase family protein n=1 Tax=Deinococcus multiflagellatus TaxID=1656887 RepID=A0ABW1ZFU1_9DEIO